MNQRWLFVGILAGVLLAETALAAGWRVIPIRLDFDQRVRSGVVTLANDSDQPISFSVDALEWTQDAEGTDHYAPTGDLVFFPKVLAIPPGEERVVRAGLKTPALKQEKTYRLFIKEEPPKRDTQGTAVAIAVRFGVPVFAKPPQEELRGEIVRAVLEQGTLRLDVRNSGNVHFRIDSTRVTGKTAAGVASYSEDLKGWYLLAGAGRTLAVAIPPAICSQLSTVEIEASGSKLRLHGKIDVDPAQCLAR